MILTADFYSLRLHSTSRAHSAETLATYHVDFVQQFQNGRWVEYKPPNIFFNHHFTKSLNHQIPHITLHKSPYYKSHPPTPSQTAVLNPSSLTPAWSAFRAASMAPRSHRCIKQPPVGPGWYSNLGSRLIRSAKTSSTRKFATPRRSTDMGHPPWLHAGQPHPTKKL